MTASVTNINNSDVVDLDSLLGDDLNSKTIDFENGKKSEKHIKQQIFFSITYRKCEWKWNIGIFSFSILFR